MKIFALDIEVQCENGFPDVEAAAEEMLSITIKDMVTKEFFVWAVREFEVPDGVKAFIFDTERDMLKTLLNGGCIIHQIFLQDGTLTYMTYLILHVG